MKNKYYLLLAVAFLGIRAGAESFVSGDMTYITTSANTVELSMCNLKEGEVKIPAAVEYGGTLYTVTSIGNDVFKSTSITAVEIPEGVTKIGNSAFQFCISMESALLPESLEHIGTSAFATCRKLSTINWPHNLKYVGANAFLYDSAYKGEIWLAKGITVEDGAFTGMFAAKKVTFNGQPAKIGEGAFNECTALTELYVNCIYPPQFDPAVVFEDDWGDSYCTDITLYVPGGAIPNYEAAPLWANVFGSIEEAEFTNTDTTKPGGSGDEPSDREYETYTDTWNDDGTIATINVPEAGSLSAILGEKAGNIEELHLSGKLNGTDILQLREMAGVSQSGTIIEGAKLKTLDILNTEIVEGGEPYYVYLEVCHTAQDEVGDKMFSYSSSLESVILPKYAISIGDDAFAQCGALKEITIGEYVKSVGELAFYYDLGLTHIALPASCTRIADMAFYACGALEKVDIPGEITKIGEATFYFCTSLKDFIIPETVTTIANLAFCNCRSLESINIPAAVQSIDVNAFGLCSSLKMFNVSADNETYSDKEGVLFNKYGTTLLKYPAGREDEHYTIPSGTVNIDVESMYEAKFVKLTVSEGVQKISDGAIAECQALTEITLPSTLTQIENHAFYNDTNLSLILIDAAVPPVCVCDEDNTPFSGVNVNECEVIVPDNSEKAYATADVWSEFMNLHSVGVEKVVTPDRFVIERYNIDGKGASGNAKGLIIVRYSDGTVAKQIVK